MSIRHSTLMFICVLAIGFASHEAGVSGGRGRGPSSERASTKAPLVLRQKVDLPHTDKLRGPLEATIEMISEPPMKKDDTFVVRGLVSTSEPLKNVKMKWSLPEGVELVSGAKENLISAITPEQPYIAELTLRQVSEENAQIHLLVNATNRRTKFGDSAQYNTLTQGQLDAERKDLSIKSAPDATNAKKRLKIRH